MAETRKSRSMFKIVNDTEAYLRNLLYIQPKAWLLQAREKLRDLPKTNFDLGCMFAEQGKWHDAKFRFKVALYLNPKYPLALYNLGCCYFHLGQMPKARATMQQVLRETPDHAEAIFMLGAIDPNALTPEQRPRFMPRDLVSKFFSSVAGNYNKMEAENNYRGGVLVAEQVKPLLPVGGITIVDLGCGTGIAAIPYRTMAAYIIGVEMTPAMAAQARNTADGDKKLYDQVVEADIATLGEQVTASSADLVLVVNVTQFIGGLEDTLRTATRIAKPGGLIAITVEPYGKDGFGLAVDTGRFGHSATYVKQLAASNGLEAVKQTPVALYPQPAAAAELILLRKGGH